MDRRLSVTRRMRCSAARPRREADHLLAVTDETWQQMRAVNVDAGFHLARELARQLIAARRPGSFLMLTSLHATTPRNLPHYSTAKAALAMLVKEMAKSFGRYGIRVNALVPGAVAAGGFRRRSRTGAAHSLGPVGAQRRSRTARARGAVGQDIRLRHRRIHRHRRRALADELVRPARFRRAVERPAQSAVTFCRTCRMFSERVKRSTAPAHPALNWSCFAFRHAATRA